MPKLNEEWFDAFQWSFKTDEDVIEFIFEHLDTSNFQDSYIDAVGFGEPNERFKITADDKKQLLYNFVLELVQYKEEVLGRQKTK